MKRLLSPIAAVLAALPVAALAASDLFFSEYIEGSSNNKALEIFNNTGATVDLDGYAIQMYFNGNSNPGLTIPLSGTLADGDVYVVAQSNAAPAILAVADQTNGAGWFNGDDAVVLLSGGAVIDAIGQIGFDPGSQWGSGLASTQNNTLRRAASIDGGDSDALDVFEPALEWDGFPQDTFDGLGSVGGSEPPVDIGQCGDPATPIHAIQGGGATSPLVGTTQVIEGVVVGDFQGADALRGFFVQEEQADQDGDSQTSEGIFVFDGAGTVAVGPGDIVRVGGEVTEFFGMTQITNLTGIEVCGSGADFNSVALTLPQVAAGDLERFEGMAVTTTQTLVISENFNLARFGELLLSADSRLLQPTQVVAPGADAATVLAANNLNRLILDDGSTVQNPQTIPYPAPRLTADNTLRVGDSVAPLTGVLNFSFSEYRLHPTEAPTFIPSNPRTVEPDLSGTGDVKVASFNVLNYFNGDGQGGGFPTPRGADSLSEFERQRAKTISALLALDADIIGLVEIENDGFGGDSAIQDLVNGLNAGGANYALVDPGVDAIGTDAIAVGFIYRPDAVELVNAPAILDSSVDPDFIDTKNRPVLAQTFRGLSGQGVFTVAVGHLKSKGSDCDELGDPDTGDGQGNCNLTRTAAAQALVDWLASDPTNSNDSDFLIVGDLNAYAKEDPIRAIELAGYTNLVEQFVGAAAHSFVFRGQSGYLDHALANGSMQGQVQDLTEWLINADEPRALDYNEENRSPLQVVELFSDGPYRASDHDPIVMLLDLEHKAGDINGDGRLNFRDLRILISRLHQAADGDNDLSDIHRDGVIDRRDLKAWLRLFFKSGKKYWYAHRG